MGTKYEEMYLISKQENNMHLIQPQVTLPKYKSPEEKFEDRSFKILGSQYENKANQLYKDILKYSCVNEKINCMKNVMICYLLLALTL